MGEGEGSKGRGEGKQGARGREVVLRGREAGIGDPHVHPTINLKCDSLVISHDSHNAVSGSSLTTGKLFFPIFLNITFCHHG